MSAVINRGYEVRICMSALLILFRGLDISSPLLFYDCGPGSSVGIATDYGMDGPGSNPGEDEIFRPFRPALGPTQPPVHGYWLFPGGKVRPGRAAEHSPSSSAAVMEE